MNEQIQHDEKIQIAKTVKEELLNTALQAYKDAAENGVCCEGARECAVDAVRSLKPEEIIKLLEK
jgi:cation transport regulator ChaB